VEEADSKRASTEEPLWRAPTQAERLAELVADDPALKEVPLRRDVRSLGILLGRVLREQEGEALYAAVEELRGLLIRSRGGDPAETGVSPPSSSDAGMDRAAAIVAALGVEQAYGLTNRRGCPPAEHAAGPVRLGHHALSEACPGPPTHARSRWGEARRSRCRWSAGPR
jgi:hypothetical protein